MKRLLLAPFVIVIFAIVAVIAAITEDRKRRQLGADYEGPAED